LLDVRIGEVPNIPQFVNSLSISALDMSNFGNESKFGLIESFIGNVSEFVSESKTGIPIIHGMISLRL
jgi:hypothetical protein